MPWFPGSETKIDKKAHVEESNILGPQPEPTRTLHGMPRPLWQIFQKSIFDEHSISQDGIWIAGRAQSRRDPPGLRSAPRCHPRPVATAPGATCRAP